MNCLGALVYWRLLVSCYSFSNRCSKPMVVKQGTSLKSSRILFSHQSLKTIIKSESYMYACMSEHPGTGDSAWIHIKQVNYLLVCVRAFMCVCVLEGADLWFRMLLLHWQLIWHQVHLFNQVMIIGILKVFSNEHWKCFICVLCVLVILFTFFKSKMM